MQVYFNGTSSQIFPEIEKGILSQRRECCTRHQNADLPSLQVWSSASPTTNLQNYDATVAASIAGRVGLGSTGGVILWRGRPSLGSFRSLKIACCLSGRVVILISSATIHSTLKFLCLDEFLLHFQLDAILFFTSCLSLVYGAFVQLLHSLG